MAVPPVAMRCPACGAELRAVPAASPPTQWFPCPHCSTPVPVVVPRDLPPLYSWEVLPGLYPALPIPRPRRWPVRRIVAATLAIIAVLAVAVAGVLIAEGVRATAPAKYTVSGTVVDLLSGGGSIPAVGARVVLTDERGTMPANFTNGRGAFTFGGVPSGGFSLNITQTGYAPVEVSSFVSPVYDAGSTGLTVGLSAGPLGNGTNVSLSPFPDLETFVAYLGGGASLLGLIAAVSAIAGIVTARYDRPAVGVVGGAAGVGAPVSLLILSLGSIFPLVAAGVSVAGALGAFVLALRASEVGLVEEPAPTS
jgi:hypothetical protein